MGYLCNRAIYAVERAELQTITLMVNTCSALEYRQYYVSDILRRSVRIVKFTYVWTIHAFNPIWTVSFVFLVKSQPNVLDSHRRLQVLRQVSVFFHSLTSLCLLILSLWKDLHALIMLRTNLNRRESSGLLVWVPCGLPQSTFYIGETTLSLSIYINSTLTLHEHRETTCTRVYEQTAACWTLCSASSPLFT